LPRVLIWLGMWKPAEATIQLAPCGASQEIARRCTPPAPGSRSKRRRRCGIWRAKGCGIRSSLCAHEVCVWLDFWAAAPGFTWPVPNYAARFHLRNKIGYVADWRLKQKFSARGCAAVAPASDGIEKWLLEHCNPRENRRLDNQREVPWAWRFVAIEFEAIGRRLANKRDCTELVP